ncbi:transcriptional regulator [Pseudomonas sp. 21]|uniref:LysR substrate-binding domain-containing protein n=1 Tax=unclassified Pseudomonas TaxID=196821 RepID=UPI0005EB39DE|nr:MULTISPECIES: LysR family transcriptional regulator [unclassified Pseudomonas]KJJ97753.1 transcriptional regulator [Pseudomonas sp. 21]MBV7585377.1 LysR family transcriptional regulator [Pseudomonas sp. PDM33]
MERIEQYRIFIQVAELGSFIQASRVLKLPRATVSAAVQQLEGGVGTRLLHRTTRKVSLTADGLQLLERARQLLHEYDEVDQLFQTHPQQISGRLDVDVPSRIARRLLIPALPEFLRQYPRLQLGLGSTDRLIDPVSEGVDCVIRFGRLASSSLVVKPLGQVLLVNCASPAYLAEHGVPRHLDDLRKGHQAIGYSPSTGGQAWPWEYIDEGREQRIELPGRVIVNNVESYIASCCAGLGLIQVPWFDVQHLLDAGALVEVLPEHRPAPMPVSMLYPNRRQRSRRLAVFLDWFGAQMQPFLAP